jgi:phosphohistidine phosphatase
MPGHRLYLIRHGLAEEQGEAWPDDGQRPLTDEGLARVRKSAQALARMGIEIDIVLTSPLVRTRQTAEGIAEAFEPRPPIVAIESLAPHGSTQAALADLEKHARRSSIALVGHEPGIGELAARLVGLRHALEFKKGAIARIDVEGLPPAGAGLLRWFLSPRVLRSLKR